MFIRVVSGWTPFLAEYPVMCQQYFSILTTDHADDADERRSKIGGPRFLSALARAPALTRLPRRSLGEGG
jgi:hypothetical protein